VHTPKGGRVFGGQLCHDHGPFVPGHFHDDDDTLFTDHQTTHGETHGKTGKNGVHIGPQTDDAANRPGDGTSDFEPSGSSSKTGKHNTAKGKKGQEHSTGADTEDAQSRPSGHVVSSTKGKYTTNTDGKKGKKGDPSSLFIGQSIDRGESRNNATPVFSVTAFSLAVMSFYTVLNRRRRYIEGYEMLHDDPDNNVDLEDLHDYHP